jgi:predicted Zn-dependent protease with MMP-like domain
VGRGQVRRGPRRVRAGREADPKFVAAHLNRAELLVEEFGAHEEAIAHCDRLLAGGGELPRLDRGTEAEVYYLKAKALFYQNDLDGALFLLRRAMKAGGEQDVYRAFEGQLLFEQARFEDARKQLERAVALNPDAAHAVYHLGLVLERLGETEEAARMFERAHGLDPELYAMPVEIDDETFERTAREALEDLPRSLRETAQSIPVLIEDAPSEEMLTRLDFSPQILGIFIGTPRTEAAVTDQPRDLDRIVIFKKNLEKACRDRDELLEQIKITVSHELGHYLGFTEEDLERLGLA